MENEIDGIILFVDKRQTLYLFGTTIDYFRGVDEEGFNFLNTQSS